MWTLGFRLSVGNCRFINASINWSATRSSFIAAFTEYSYDVKAYPVVMLTDLLFRFNESGSMRRLTHLRIQYESMLSSANNKKKLSNFRPRVVRLCNEATLMIFDHVYFQSKVTTPAVGGREDLFGEPPDPIVSNSFNIY